MNRSAGERLLGALFLPRSSSSDLALIVWAIAAATSLTVASAIALQPGYLEDLTLVREWLAVWSAGGNPYSQSAAIDYPPNSFLILWPLKWITTPVAAAVMIAASIGATAVATWLASGWLAERFAIVLSSRDRAMLVGIMLAGSSLRSALWRGQTAPLAFLFGAAALHLSRRHPRWAAVALALCAFKPHVAIGFALAILVTEGVAIVLQAVALTAAMTWLFAWGIGHTFLDVVQTYASGLLQMYNGDGRVRGLLSMRWVIEDLLGSYDAGTVVYAAATLISAALLLDAAFSTRRAADRARVAAAFMVWALIFLPHQLYHGWMAAPALWLMMWPESGMIANDRLRLWVVAIFVAVGVFDVPRLMRLFFDADVQWTYAWMSYALSPLRMAFLFGLLLVTVMRRAQTPEAPLTS